MCICVTSIQVHINKESYWTTNLKLVGELISWLNVEKEKDSPEGMNKEQKKTKTSNAKLTLFSLHCLN